MTADSQDFASPLSKGRNVEKKHCKAEHLLLVLLNKYRARGSQ